MELLFTVGSFCAIRSMSNYQINLYQVFGFYVEAWYNLGMNRFEKFIVVNDNIHFFVDDKTHSKTYQISS